jgi:SRSO17 transposase
VAYIRELTKVIGHADPRETVADFLLRTTGDGGRRSLHPIAAVNGDGAGLGCSGELVLATVRELVMPSTTHRGPLEAWIIDDKSFPKKGWHSAAVHHQHCGQLGEQASQCR